MRSKRLTRSNKGQDANDKVKKSGTESKHSSRVAETRNILSTSTPAKQSTRPCGDTVLSDDTDDDISLVLRDTPTGLRMKSFFRDEFLSSQACDSQLDVRWDHTSPDAYKRLQRVPKKSLKQAREDLSDIVCRLAPSVNGEEFESVSSTPPLLCSWLQANKATSNNAPFEGQIFKHGQRAKRGLKKKKKPNIQKFDDVLNSLHMCLERFDNDEDAENDKAVIQRSSESSTEDDTLAHEAKDLNSNRLKLGHPEESSLLPKDATQALLEEEEELWSDDELFEDNSFILQATQLPVDKVSRFSPSLCGGKRKQISPVLDQPKNKTKRCAVSPKWEKESDSNDMIPPTCAMRSNFTNSGRNSEVSTKSRQITVVNGRGNVNMKSCENSNVNYGRQISTAFYPDNSTCGNKPSARSPFRKHSSFSGYEANKPPSACSSTVTNNSKSPWRKTTSFSGSGTTTNNKQQQCKAQTAAAQPVLREKQVQNKLFKDQKPRQSVTHGQGSGQKVPQKETVPAVRQISPVASHKRSSLDTSFSDEILRQLAEPDELFESQIDPVPVTTGATKEVHGEFEDFFDSDDDFSINETMMLEPTKQKPNVNKCSNVNSAVKPVNQYALPKPCVKVQQKQDAQRNKQQESNQNGLANLSLKSTGSSALVSNSVSKPTLGSKTNGAVAASSSSQVSSQNRFTFRSTTRLQKPSKPTVVSGGNLVTSKMSTKQQQNTAKSTMKSPVLEKKTKTSPKAAPASKSAIETITDTQALFSSQALLEDDSFMKDDALFESQILAMLDEVEYEASQQSKPETAGDADRISCSPDEIEQKRLAALAKRKAKNAR